MFELVLIFWLLMLLGDAYGMRRWKYYQVTSSLLVGTLCLASGINACYEGGNLTLQAAFLLGVGSLYLCGVIFGWEGFAKQRDRDGTSQP